MNRRAFLGIIPAVVVGKRCDMCGRTLDGMPKFAVRCYDCGIDLLIVATNQKLYMGLRGGGKTWSARGSQ